MGRTKGHRTKSTRQTDDKKQRRKQNACSYCAFIRIHLFTVKCQSHLDYIQANYTVTLERRLYKNVVPIGVQSR